MSKKHQKYAKDNQDIYDQYHITQNVITRNSLLTILENRLNRGDLDAKPYIISIKEYKLSTKGNQTCLPNIN